MGTPLRFDTLQFSSDLQDAGMDKKQADALAKGLYNSQDRMIENLATKQDIELVKKDLEAVEQRLVSEIGLLKWMIGTTLTGVLAILIKTFF